MYTAMCTGKMVSIIEQVFLNLHEGKHRPTTEEEVEKNMVYLPFYQHYGKYLKALRVQLQQQMKSGITLKKKIPVEDSALQAVVDDISTLINANETFKMAREYRYIDEENYQGIIINGIHDWIRTMVRVSKAIGQLEKAEILESCFFDTSGPAEQVIFEERIIVNKELMNLDPKKKKLTPFARNLAHYPPNEDRKVNNMI